jgi:hypothetical protein
MISCMSPAYSEMDSIRGNAHVASYFDGLFAVFTYFMASRSYFIIYVTELAQYFRSHEIRDYSVKQSEIFARSSYIN